MSTFDGCCGSCVHMNTNDYTGSKDHCYCTYRRQYYNLQDRKCSYYEYDRNKDYYDLNHRWHVVSAVLHILKTEARSLGLELLQNFRVNILEEDERYADALRVYDVIGPFLAGCLINDPDSGAIGTQLVDSWFRPIEAEIEAGHNDAAFCQYAKMIVYLARRYEVYLRAYCCTKRITVEALNMERCMKS